MIFNRKKKRLKDLVERASSIGLRAEDRNAMDDFIANHEFGLALDTLVTQLHEYDVEVPLDFYEEVEKLCILYGLQETDYTYLYQVVRDRGKILDPVQEKIYDILKVLKENKKPTEPDSSPD